MRIVVPSSPFSLHVVHCKPSNAVSFLKRVLAKEIKAMAARANKSDKKRTQIIDMSTIFGVIKHGNLAAVRQFIDENGEDVLKRFDADGYTPIHWAVHAGTCETVGYLLSMEGVVFDSSANINGQQPIHWACSKDRIDIIKLLLDRGVDINAQDKKNFTPLITAAYFGHVATVCFLLSRNARLDLSDINNDNALHWAVYKGYPDLTRLFILYGINPRRIDNHGQSVLHLSCFSGNLNIVQQFVEQDCIDTEIIDKNGYKAIDIARKFNHGDIVDFIQRYNRQRKSRVCNLKTFFFGPVGNSKLVVFFIHAMYLIYQYPLYALRVLPDTWHEYTLLNLVYLFSNVFMWTAFYAVHLTEPGYLKQNTFEYQNSLRNITFCSQSFSAAEWHRQLSRLCHTCKTVKPYRASHCRACNRCVLAYDHHCPYIQNCVGYQNRPYFFAFVLAMVLLQVSTAGLICVTLYQTPNLYIIYPGAAVVLLFGIMVLVLLTQAIASTIFNLTGNEISKMKKYDYLRNSNGNYRNIFSKGVCYNIRYYFHLVEPSNLESTMYESMTNHII